MKRIEEKMDKLNKMRKLKEIFSPKLFLFRVALIELNKPSKHQKIMGEEIKIIEGFPEKVIEK